MLELTDWIASASLPERDWLVLGKGPTFDRLSEFDLTAFNLLSLNHVVNELAVDVAHVIDVNVVHDCATALETNARWVVMPRFPHVHSEHGVRRLEEWFDEIPVLRELDRTGRLVWYNVSGATPIGRSPVVGAKFFSSEAALNILGLMSVKRVRSLGIDGGRSYSRSFGHLEASTLLENGAPLFDVQFEQLQRIAAERDIDYRPLVEPPQVVITVRDDVELVPYRVLEYSIRKHAAGPVDVRLLRSSRDSDAASVAPAPLVVDENASRVVHLGAPMLVLGDIRELVEAPTVPEVWNHVERLVPGVTRLLHYAHDATRPWVSGESPLGEIWMGWYREAVEAGAVPPEEVEALVSSGDLHPALAVALRAAPGRRSVLTAASIDLATARHRISSLEAELDDLRRSRDLRVGRTVMNALRLPGRVSRKLRRLRDERAI